MSDRQVPLVIYHGGCRDGFCAAWVAHKAMPDAEFFAAQYGSPPPDVGGRDVFVVDFCYQRGTMEMIRDRAKSLVVLDHHKTAQEALAGFDGSNVHVTFDMERSGAGIAWDYFNPGTVRPWPVDYVEDRDLWRHTLPSSESIGAYLGTVPYHFGAWDVAAGLGTSHARNLGEAVEAKIAHYITEVSKNARRIVFEGYDVPIVNAPQVDISELVGAMSNGETFAMGWWQRADGKFSYSLRSRGDFDVSELAKRHGGGGHKNAAGFLLDRVLG